MTDEILLSLLKSNLEIISPIHDDYLYSLITAAQQMITREGVTLGESDEDCQLVVMYAAYLYRKRAEDSPVMPRMLRYALNNRIFSEKVSG